MARTIFWYVSFWLLQLLSVIFLAVYFLLGLPGLKSVRQKFLYLTTRTWARLLLAIAGARVEVSGLENLPAGGGVLFVANHQGAFDIPLLLGHVPGLKGFVAKKEILRLPIVGIWIKLLRCVILDRRDLRQSARAIARGVNDLRSGRSLIVFPEGTRSKSGVMNRFKGGSFKLATRSRAAIVPLTIDGSYRLLEGNRGRITPGKVHLYIHPPLSYMNLNDAEKEVLTETVQRTIASKLTVGRP
jgi:1-acyl-sn-glycerol-3-phosphate acyltransferase